MINLLYIFSKMKELELLNLVVGLRTVEGKKLEDGTNINFWISGIHNIAQASVETESQIKVWVEK